MAKRMTPIKIILIVCVIIITLLCVGALTIYQVNEFYSTNDPVLSEITSLLHDYFQKDHFPEGGELSQLNGRIVIDEIVIQASTGGSFTINKKSNS